jgi:Zn-dependent protease
MSPAVVLASAAVALVLLRAFRYLMAARVFLTCALREVEARPVHREQIDPGELRLITLLDEELASAGFRLLGFGSVTPSITYFGGALTASVFVNEQIPAYAFVHRHMAPESGRLVELDIRTALDPREEIITGNTPSSSAFVPPGMRIETLPGMGAAAVVGRHVARVAAISANEQAAGRRVAEHGGLQDALNLVAAGMVKSRWVFREHGWVVPTTDPRLDRFTLRGAFALTRQSLQGIRARRRAGGRPPTPIPTPTAMQPVALSSAPLNTDDLQALRVEADLQAILHVADHPETAPGTPWPLLTVIAATAALSFVAMAALWNTYIAGLILAIIAFHEAGHAIAMRSFGYRDVHVFFVPLLGAMTVGRAVVTSVRDRLSVLLAGPVPGLWLAVVLLVIDQSYGPARILRSPAIALLILNGLNLLPFTPLDGGRVLEALTRPESVWRLIVQGVSAAGLLALAAVLQDPVVAIVGLYWVALLPKSLASYRLRSAVARKVENRSDFRSVARTTLDVMLTPPYAQWRAVTRQATARAIARLFAESLATPADRRWGAVAYAAAWLPVVAALMLWTK